MRTCSAPDCDKPARFGVLLKTIGPGALRELVPPPRFGTPLCADHKAAAELTLVLPDPDEDELVIFEIDPKAHDRSNGHRKRSPRRGRAVPN